MQIQEYPELVSIKISKQKHPNAFLAKVKELVSNGLSEEEAINFIESTTFEMELYYEDNNGLFLVESDAVESVPIFSPYTKQELDQISEG